jgi:RHS repeat-associated protein
VYFSNANFAYAGDGRRVKSVITTNAGSTTTYFIGNYYEVTGSTITKYYYAGSQRIAMRENNVLSYIFGDHLGSTSLVTDSNGNLINQTKYKAWGEERYSSGTNPSEYTYTGQYSYTSDFGLMYYGARWFDPSLGRFTSPDTIIPDQYNSLDWDRYTYTRNNPLIYTDPTGHNPVWVLIGLLVAAAVLTDYGDNGQVDTLSPDAVTVSYSANDSTGTLQYENDKESPLIAGVDGVFTGDEAADFYTSTENANESETGETYPYAHAESPTIGVGGAIGLLWSQDVKEDLVQNFSGTFYNIAVSGPILGMTAYTSIDPITGEADYNTVGLTITIAKSFAPSIGGYYTNSTPKSKFDSCYPGRAGIKSTAC